MEISYDKSIDAAYIRLRRCKVKKTIPVNDRFMVDIDAKGDVVGIELLDASLQMWGKNTI